MRFVDCKGFTLVEGLVALLVLAMGLIGIAALHAERIRPGSGGALHARAVELAGAMATRIRSARSPDLLYEDSIGIVCSKDLRKTAPQAVVANEVACWQESLAERLPNGTGSIRLDRGSVPAAYIVTVSWFQAGTGTASYVVRVAAPQATPLPPAVPAAG